MSKHPLHYRTLPAREWSRAARIDATLGGFRYFLLLAIVGFTLGAVVALVTQ